MLIWRIVWNLKEYFQLEKTNYLKLHIEPKKNVKKKN